MTLLVLIPFLGILFSLGHKGVSDQRALVAARHAGFLYATQGDAGKPGDAALTTLVGRPTKGSYPAPRPGGFLDKLELPDVFDLAPLADVKLTLDVTMESYAPKLLAAATLEHGFELMQADDAGLWKTPKDKAGLLGILAGTGFDVLGDADFDSDNPDLDKAKSKPPEYSEGDPLEAAKKAVDRAKSELAFAQYQYNQAPTPENKAEVEKKKQQLQEAEDALAEAEAALEEAG